MKETVGTSPALWLSAVCLQGCQGRDGTVLRADASPSHGRTPRLARMHRAPAPARGASRESKSRRASSTPTPRIRAGHARGRDRESESRHQLLLQTCRRGCRHRPDGQALACSTTPTLCIREVASPLEQRDGIGDAPGESECLAEHSCHDQLGQPSIGALNATENGAELGVEVSRPVPYRPY